MGLSFGDVVSAYRFLRSEMRDEAAASHFTQFIGLVGQATTQNTMKVAIQALAALPKYLPQLGDTEIDLPTNPTVRLMRQEGIQLIEQIRGIKTPEDIAAVIKKVKQVAKEHFSAPDHVEATLLEAAARQQNKLVGARTFAGFVGLYELASKRYHSFRSDDPMAKIVKALMIPIHRILQSFPESGARVSEEEALANLKILASQLAKDKDKITALCEPGSHTARTVATLGSLQNHPETSQAFYRLLKAAVIQHCFDLGICTSASGTVVQTHITRLFEEQAKVAAEHLPAHLQPDQAQTGRMIASAFAQHTDHGQGALLFGQLGLNMHREQFFGEGINWSPTFNPIDPYNDVSKDSIRSDRAREVATKVGKDIAHGFYENRQLAQQRYIIDGDTVVAEPVHDPNAQALMTVQSLIQYELQRHVIDHGLMFGLDAGQRVALAPEKAKKVILFGINNDIFTMQQGTLLVMTYQLMGDPDIRAAAHQAMIRNAPPVDAYEEEAANLRNIQM